MRSSHASGVWRHRRDEVGMGISRDVDAPDIYFMRHYRARTRLVHSTSEARHLTKHQFCVAEYTGAGTRSYSEQTTTALYYMMMYRCKHLVLQRVDNSKEIYVINMIIINIRHHKICWALNRQRQTENSCKTASVRRCRTWQRYLGVNSRWRVPHVSVYSMYSYEGISVESHENETRYSTAWTQHISFGNVSTLYNTWQRNHIQIHACTFMTSS